MANQNDWYKVLTLARVLAANDMRISNKILDISDFIKQATKNRDLTEQEIAQITEDLVQTSLELSENSKNLNYAITRLAGVI